MICASEWYKPDMEDLGGGAEENMREEVQGRSHKRSGT